MRLHILRHAKTDPFSDSGKDFDRKLLKKGELQSFEMGKYFIQKEIDPSFIFCSSATRAKQTISNIRKVHSFDHEIIYLHEFYLCEKEVLLAFLWEQNHNKDILIVGHNNGLSDFASYLVDDFIDLKTCEFISIEFEVENWKETSKGMGVICDHFHPKV